MPVRIKCSFSNSDIGGFKFRSLKGTEKMSSPYDFDVELLINDTEGVRLDLLGENITVEIPCDNENVRYLNGIITHYDIHNEFISGERYTVYSVKVTPELWKLSNDSNIRIFRNSTVVEMISKILAEYGVIFINELTNSYRLWEYCVQYQESSLNFIHRLMELEGISYYFKHYQNTHCMILVDSASVITQVQGYEQIDIIYTTTAGVPGQEGINQWKLSGQATPGIYSINDYDFRKPDAWLYQARPNTASPYTGGVDVYEWPGRYVESYEGGFYAQMRQQAWKALSLQANGIGSSKGITPGRRFTLYDPTRPTIQENFTVISANYDIAENIYSTTSNMIADTKFTISFCVIPADVTFRPVPITPWPKCHGPQTAEVVGPVGESVWTDLYGRVKLKFHWDRATIPDEERTCWVRVSSAWASQNYGIVQIPRAGDEVIVDFINGDPDRPIITGRVYNASNMSPWSLPGAATQMGTLSRTIGGTPDNANAFRFEDMPGAEQIWMHAERNMDTEIENDETHKVGNNRQKSVEKDETTQIGQNRTESVGSNEKIDIQQDRTEQVGGNESVSISGNQQLSVGQSRTKEISQDETQKIGQNSTSEIGKNATNSIGENLKTDISKDESRSVGQNQNISVGQDKSESISQNLKQDIGQNMQTSVGQSQSTEVQQQYSLSAGQDISISSDTSISIDAQNSITLTSGQSSIFLDQSGNIDISGVNITISGQSSVKINGARVDIN